jgi:hypothetical protein
MPVLTLGLSFRGVAEVTIVSDVICVTAVTSGYEIVSVPPSRGGRFSGCIYLQLMLDQIQARLWCH